MAKARNDIKVRIIENEMNFKKFFDLLELPYMRTAHQINGYSKLPLSVENRMIRTLNELDLKRNDSKKKL